MLLDTIHSRQDLLDIPEDQLGTLCGEIQLEYDTAHDRLVFDVGHQCYVHKMLTGRMDRFDTLRQRGGAFRLSEAL